MTGTQKEDGVEERAEVDPRAKWALGVSLLLLALNSGVVDAVSFLRLEDIFTANMTGNTVLLGIALGRGEFETALRAAVALAGFSAGVVGGSLISRRGDVHALWPPVVTVTLAVELVLLAAFAGVWFAAGRAEGVTVYPLIVAASVAMGLQAAALRRLGVSGVRSTALTNTMINLMTRLADSLRPPAPADDRDVRKASATEDYGPGLPVGVWVFYTVGGALGALSIMHLETLGVVLPLAIVGAVTVAAVVGRLVLR